VTEPYVNTTLNTTLYFRGKRVMDALLEVLLLEHGLSQAEEVLLSGGSAGGLSTYLHADYVKTKMPATVKKYKAAPNSGFFALHADATGTPLYPDEMKYVHTLPPASATAHAHA
jgi:hypothetical protein